MSSTVGYGVQISGIVFDDKVEMGDWESEVDAKYPSLVVVRSRPEYTDDEAPVFVLVQSSVAKAGSSWDGAKVATAFNPVVPNLDGLNEFLAEAQPTTVSELSWFLVDYYPEG